MKTIEIYIDKGQYLDKVYHQIETNTIINKTICGCGATYLELETPRHSIIIEPNLPVILGKKAKHKSLFGVHEGVTAEHIEKYLKENSSNHKIMTTPESFGKVRTAIRNTTMNLHKDFFLLFDECERTTQDIDFRNTITLPIHDFFKAEHKAMVSATPIIAKDPRFEIQGFKLVKIVPTYDYRQDLTLITTNNVYTALRRYLDELPQGETVCMFHNSTEGIRRIIEHLGIEEQSNIYCSTKSREQFIEDEYTQVFDRLNEVGQEIKLNRYNFFTSRFYSAVDIELPYKPTVIMITEVFSAPFSPIDPTTEAVQIAGRFRNGLNRLIHITNYNSKAEVQTQAQIEQFLNEQHNIYAMLHKMFQNSIVDGERFLLRQAMERVDYAKYTWPLGEPNMFMYNNAFIEERLKVIYKSVNRIVGEYEKSSAFNVTHQPDFLSTTDNDRSILNPSKSAKQTELNKEALKQVKRLIPSENEYDKQYLNQIYNGFKTICEGVKELGIEGVEQTDFKDQSIMDAIEHSKLTKKRRSAMVKCEVYKAFNENTRYTVAEINEKLKTIYRVFGIPYDGRGCAGSIDLYFEVREDNQSRDRGWMLLKRRY